MKKIKTFLLFFHYYLNFKNSSSYKCKELTETFSMLEDRIASWIVYCSINFTAAILITAKLGMINKKRGAKKENIPSFSFYSWNYHSCFKRNGKYVKTNCEFFDPREIYTYISYLKIYEKELQILQIACFPQLSPILCSSRSECKKLQLMSICELFI